MKYLQDYMTERQSAAFKKAKAFFAFSDKQLQEGLTETNQNKEDVVSMGNGLIAAKNQASTLFKELEQIYTESIQQDIEENGLNAIIRRELSNHEAYYTGDIESTVDALEDYPVTAEDIHKVYRNRNHEVPLQRNYEHN